MTKILNILSYISHGVRKYSNQKGYDEPVITLDTFNDKHRTRLWFVPINDGDLPYMGIDLILTEKQHQDGFAKWQTYTLTIEKSLHSEPDDVFSLLSCDLLSVETLEVIHVGG